MDIFLISSDYTLDHVSTCAGGGGHVGGNLKVHLKLGVSAKKCTDILNEINGESDSCLLQLQPLSP